MRLSSNGGLKNNSVFCAVSFCTVVMTMMKMAIIVMMMKMILMKMIVVMKMKVIQSGMHYEQRIKLLHLI